MLRFIQYTNKDGRKVLVNLNQVDKIVDDNKCIYLYLKDEVLKLPISYTTLISFLEKGDKTILTGGCEI